MTDRNLLAWVEAVGGPDDPLVPLPSAHVSVLDQGFRTGEGVFETLRAYGEHVFRLDAHLRRAALGARELGFSAPARDHLANAVRTTVAANRGRLADADGPDLAVRLTLTPGPLDADDEWPLRPVGLPTVVVTAHPLQDEASAWREGIRAVTVPWTRGHPDIKAVSYLPSMLARARARAAGAEEALLTEGDVVHEGASSNVFVVVAGRVVTPPVSDGLLAGVTRQVVVEVAPTVDVRVEPATLTLAMLQGADEAFVTSTTRELVPLVAVDDVPIGSGRPGPLTAALHRAYRAEVQRERTS